MSCIKGSTYTPSEAQLANIRAAQALRKGIPKPLSEKQIIGRNRRSLQIAAEKELRILLGLQLSDKEKNLLRARELYRLRRDGLWIKKHSGRYHATPEVQFERNLRSSIQQKQKYHGFPYSNQEIDELIAAYKEKQKPKLPVVYPESTKQTLADFRIPEGITGGIYKLTCIVTNKSYIGQTKQFSRRISAHYSKSIVRHHIQNAVAKYGMKAFEVEILIAIDDEDTRDQLEIACIKTYNTLSPNGYNMTTGGQYGRHAKRIKPDISPLD